MLLNRKRFVISAKETVFYLIYLLFESGFVELCGFVVNYEFGAIGLVSNGLLLGTVTEKTKINFEPFNFFKFFSHFLFPAIWWSKRKESLLSGKL